MRQVVAGATRWLSVEWAWGMRCSCTVGIRKHPGACSNINEELNSRQQRSDL